MPNEITHRIITHVSKADYRPQAMGALQRAMGIAEHEQGAFREAVRALTKTGRVVLVEEGAKTGSVSAELAAQIMERFPENLLAPPTRVTSPDTPPPFSPVLEDAYRPDAVRIAQGIRDTIGYDG